MPLSILLYGVGSVGAIYLHQLQRAGCTVTAICRSNHDAVRTSGFTMTSALFGTVTYRPDHVYRSVYDLPRDQAYDYIIVTAKCFPDSTPSLAEQLRPALTNPSRPTTAIVLAQNGIDIETPIAAAYPDNPLISAVIYLPATQTEPGIIQHPESLNKIELGTYPATAPQEHMDAATKLAETMRSGGGEASVFEDIQEARWKKLLLNAACNPTGALSMCTDGGFLVTSPFAKDLVWGVMMEVVALARKVGVAGVDEEAAEKLFAISKRRAEQGTGRALSMLQDVRMGRPFEVEAIVGNAVRLGRRMGVDMPRLETVYALAKGRYDVMVETGK
ncbi:hypothetical protein N8T08_001434 [Aspergillus melleus]|uniref:Uncharacterized protein n=1 Tax=Aspergillus melleus TaxID=138277 RepID=A0ACC3BAA1_9EURO|nr:hypothetical protein N8T08_001434 [Aspergillus melleus]